MWINLHFLDIKRENFKNALFFFSWKKNGFGGYNHQITDKIPLIWAPKGIVFTREKKQGDFEIFRFNICKVDAKSDFLVLISSSLDQNTSLSSHLKSSEFHFPRFQAKFLENDWKINKMNFEIK